MFNLNELETGDVVLCGKSKSKCIVNKIKKIDAFSFLIILFNTSNSTQTSYHYDESGKNKHDGIDIVGIIKNHKCWTDEDMKEAFNSGISLVNENISVSEWLGQYKINKECSTQANTAGGHKAQLIKVKLDSNS